MPKLAMDEDGLRELVDAFYTRVRADAELGPIFNNAVADWPEHLDKLADFWSSVMLTSGRYHGQPLPAHMKHRARIAPAHFDRWLGLWAATTDELLSPPDAAAMQLRAGRIAVVLKSALQVATAQRPLH